MATTNTYFEEDNNRVSDALKYYAEQEATRYIANPIAGKTDKDAMQAKLNYYTGVLNEIKPTATGDEKLSLKYVNNQINTLKASLYPTRLDKIIYSPTGNAIRNFVSGVDLFFNKQEKILNNLKTEIIQNHNVTSLQSAFTRKGFTINLQNQLDRMVKLNLPSFDILYLDTNHNHTLYQLHCEKIPGTNLYFFEKFDASPNPTLDELRKGVINANTKHTFSASEEKSFTAEQAAKLVHGQNVAKEGTIHFMSKDTHQQKPTIESMQFNAEAELKKIHFPDLPEKEMSKMKEALKKGDSFPVSLPIPGKGDTDCIVMPALTNTKNKIIVVDTQGNFINMHQFKKENIQTMKEITKTLTGNNTPDFELDFIPKKTNKKHQQPH